MRALQLGPNSREGLWPPGFWLRAAEGLFERSRLAVGWLEDVLLSAPY